MPGAGVGHGPGHGGVAGDRVQPVHPVQHQQAVGLPALEQGGRVGPGVLDLRGHRDGVAVVLDQEHHRQPRFTAVLRLSQNSPSAAAPSPRLTSTTSSAPMPSRSCSPPCPARRMASAAPTACRHWEPVGLEVVKMFRRGRTSGWASAGRRWPGRARSPPRPGTWPGGHAQPVGQGPVPVVQEQPVLARAQAQGRRRLHRLVAGAVDLEEHLVLALAGDLPVVDAPRGVDDAQELEALGGGEGAVGVAGDRGGPKAYLLRWASAE